MSKKSKSKKTWIALGVILILAVIGVVLYFTGVWFNMWYAFQEPGFCTDQPYNKACICPEGMEKHVTGWGSPLNVFKYGCREKIPEKPYSFPMEITSEDYNNPDVQGKLLAYAKDTLREECPSCDTIACDSGKWVEYDFYGSGETVEFVGLECREQTMDDGGVNWWRVAFYLDDGALHPYIDTYCKSTDETKCQVS